MAKKTNNPRVESVANEDRDEVPPLPSEVGTETAFEPVASERAKQESTDPDPVQAVILELPLAEKAVGYQQRHLRGALPAPIAEVYQRLANGLMANGATLDDGRAVESIEHAILYVGQQLRAQNVPV